jgi:hypothetical protein
VSVTADIADVARVTTNSDAMSARRRPRARIVWALALDTTNERAATTT